MALADDESTVWNSELSQCISCPVFSVWGRTDTRRVQVFHTPTFRRRCRRHCRRRRANRFRCPVVLVDRGPGRLPHLVPAPASLRTRNPEATPHSCIRASAVPRAAASVANVSLSIVDVPRSPRVRGCPAGINTERN